MIWLGWRQQRTETVIAAALLALVAAILVPAGIEMAHAYTRDGISHCLNSVGGPPACAAVVSSFEERFSKYVDLVGWFNLVPGLFGVALAAPFALELERGTHRLAWTQSITRRRWVATKLALAVTSTLLAAAVLAAILIWWRRPLVHLDGRMDNGAFDSQGIVILGYALFALGLTLAIGAVWRRAIPAVMVAFVGYFVARIFTDQWLRQRFAPTTSLTFKGRGHEPARLYHAWVISEGPSTSAGHLLSRVKINCPPGSGKCVFPGPPEFIHAVFVPASSFWSLQLIEFGLFGGFAVALIAFAGWWTLRSE